MKRNFSILLFSICVISLSCRETTDSPGYDVCIYGGTSAGVMAAYTASMLGKKVLLIEPGRHLGGLTTGGLGYTDIGNKYAVTGLSRDFYRRLGDHYGKFEQWIFEPHVAEQLMNEYITRANVEVWYDHKVTEVEKEGAFIKSVILDNAGESRKVAARMFLDCSYEGDLMARAGVSYSVGRESNETYGETYNGVQLMEGHQFPDGIDPYKVKGDPSSGLLWGVSEESLQPEGSGDKKLQAYNFRICLTNNADNMVAITRPDGYDSTKYELLLRLFEAQPDKRKLNDYFIWSGMPNQKTDINNRGGFSTDMIGMNYDYPEADYDTRAEIVDDHVRYTKGLLYFYGHDPRVPEEMRTEMLKWGYPADEYVDNEHWSPQLYVREVRRMKGSYVMTQANCEGREVVDDGVGMAAYTMDSHNCQRIVVDGMVKNEGNVEIGGFGPYPISYRALIPKAEECKNLLVPVCLSATHIAYGSIRMEPVFMVLAQSAATAAVMAMDNNVSVQEVDVSELQSRLKGDPLVDGSTPEILVDNEDTDHVELIGNWEKKNGGGYGPSWLSFTGSGESDSARAIFRPTISSSGSYDVYVYFPQPRQLTSDVNLRITSGGESEEKVIAREDIRVEGQTSGEWVHLGSYDAAEGNSLSVAIRAAASQGPAMADAVLFIPK